MSATRVLALGLFLFTAGPAAWSAGLQVSPVRLQFAPEQQAQALQLNNNAAAPIHAQVRVMRWAQREQQDVLEAQDEILASPAIVRVLPGQAQTVRLVRSRIATAELEQSYRVLVDELPASAPDSQAAQSGLQLLMRYSIPVFIAAKSGAEGRRATESDTQPAAATRLKARLQPATGTGSRLELRNDGQQAVRISQLRAMLSDGRYISLSEGLLGYVLPGQLMAWSFEQPLSPGVVLEAQLNDEPGQQRLPLQDAAL
jgi:fimbrial chaperone protein